MASSAFNLFFLSFTLVFLTSTSSLHDSYLHRQASVLVSLKQSLHVSGPSLDSWTVQNFMSLCSWEGIHCDERNSSVVSLDISNLNISGTLSPALVQLSNLKYLNISSNQFNGSLDWDFSSMKELQVLDVYDNSFSGPLPVTVAELSMLKHLDLSGNYFSGKIPPSYGGLKELLHLSLAGNDLGGFIPRELGNLTNLRELYLGYFNVYERGIPAAIGNMVNLNRLSLASCGLQGPIPAELGNLSKLDTLFLQTNQFIGSVPPQLGNLTSLKNLDISNNLLSGNIPPEFSKLKELNLLNMFINKFHGAIPRFVQELPNMEVLNLWQNNFTGAIPSKLGGNGKLKYLDLSTNKLTGLVPKYLCYGRRLETLILLNNFLFGPLPNDLGECKTLVRVRMGQNYLSGRIPFGFLYLPEVLLMELQNNYITGTLAEHPTKVSSKLGQLNLSNNRLFGPLPSSIENFSGLQSLLISGNQFTGMLPRELGQLKRLLKLDMSRNNFSGDIPPEIGNCILLAYLDLSQNQLSGPIPIRIAQIHILNYFNVSSNYLNLSLPREIGAMKSLTSADFSHNNFSGPIPEIGQYAYFNSTSFLGNPLLCGSFLTPCNSIPSKDIGDQHSVKSEIHGKLKLIFALGLLLCSLAFALAVVIKTKSMKSKNSKLWKLTTFQKLNFGSNDLLECLKETNIIGRGGAGIVYKGMMPSGEEIAVKRLLGISKGSSHDNGFSAEIRTLGKIRHRNIVRLQAFCSNKETNLLVYEYMPNGSLGEILHGKGGGYLKWDTRLKIAIEAAKGLSYLHHDCSPLIIHRDVKSNNILLDSEFEAHVADFGLAKFLLDSGTSECMSAIAGSYGYIAPEYAYTLRVDEKSDVYSFGVVLLELATGRRPVGDFGEEGLDIVQWAKMKTGWSKERVVKILDERLSDIPLNEAMQMFFVAMLCVQEQSIERPTMREVVQMLAEAKRPQTFSLQ